jgi:hypothetical protein
MSPDYAMMRVIFHDNSTKEELTLADLAKRPHISTKTGGLWWAAAVSTRLFDGEIDATTQMEEGLARIDS